MATFERLDKNVWQADGSEYVIAPIWGSESFGVYDNNIAYHYRSPSFTGTMQECREWIEERLT